MNEKKKYPLPPEIQKGLQKDYPGVEFGIEYNEDSFQSYIGVQKHTYFYIKALDGTRQIGSFGIYPDPSCCGSCILSSLNAPKDHSLLVFKIAELMAEKVMLRGIIIYTNHSEGYSANYIKSAKEAGWVATVDFKNLNHSPYSTLQMVYKVLSPIKKPAEPAPEKKAKAQPARRLKKIPGVRYFPQVQVGGGV
jgi:hypothetical protein